MKNVLATGAFLLSVLVFVSCSKSDDAGDQDKPSISVTKPAKDAVLKYGDKLLFSANIADDVKLKQVAFSLSSTAADAWAPAEEVRTVSDKAYTFTDEDIFGEVIPNKGAGTYTLTITVTDASGKTNIDKKDFTIEAVDLAAPSMTITKPAEDGSSAVAVTSALLLSGTFKDDMELSKVVATLSKVPTQAGGTSLKGLKVITTPWAPAPFEIALDGAEQTLTDAQLFADDKAYGGNIPNDCEKGVYNLTLTLHDAAGKTLEKTIAVTIQ